MTKKTASAVAILTAGMLGIPQPACSPPPYPDGLYAELRTNRGEIVLRLEPEKTPMTTASFVGLAEGRVRNQALPDGVPFFDGTIFHRVVPGHVIQAGAPPVEGRGGPGYVIPNEIDPGLSHDRAGILGMANGGPHTNGSQFYITLGDRSYLDGDFTVFGRVQSGMDVVRRIVQGDVIEKIHIVRVGREARDFHPDTAFLNKQIEQAREHVRRDEERKRDAEAAAVLRILPDAGPAETGIRVRVLREGRGPRAKTGEGMVLLYSGRTLLEDIPFMSLDNGRPGRSDAPRRFEYIVGDTCINPGFDRGVGDLRRGEKRLLIVPSTLGYGDSGYYGPALEDEKRFVISPGTALVYEVERREDP